MNKLITVLAALLPTAFGTMLFAQDSLNVRRIGQVPASGQAVAVEVRGSFAYVADGTDGLRVLDISNPSKLHEVGYYDTPGSAREVTLAGDFAFIADRPSGVRVVNVSNPVSPYEVGYIDTPGSAESIAISGNYAYVADGTSGLRVIDISNPTAPAFVSAFDTPGDGLGLTVSGGYAYVADGNYGLRVINIQNPSAPFEAGYLDTPGYSWNVAVAGHFAYVADSHAGLRIVDVSNPAAPTEVGSYLPPCCTREVAVVGNFVYMAAAESGLRIIDVANPSTPVEVGYYDTPGTAIGIAVVNHTAYVADFYQFGIYDCSAATIVCHPTALPFVDNFDSPTLDSCWSWIREDTSHWSLTQRPGWMRITTMGTLHGNTNDAQNVLLRTVLDTNFVMETRVEKDDVAFTDGGLVVYADDANFINVYLGSVGDGSIIRTWNETNDVFTYADLLEFPPDRSEAYLRITKMGPIYKVQASTDDQIWGPSVAWQRQLGHGGLVTIGMISQGVTDINADFDFIRVDPLPGTNVCGDVSGVWDSTGSPYFVNCDVTIPTGQSLKILPGVQVLFTGHYMFTVNGALSAQGTLADSIVFSSADGAGGVRWNGIGIVTQVPCTLSYCHIEWADIHGVWLDHATLTMLNSELIHTGGGLGAYTSETNIKDCVLRANSNTYDGGGGDWWHSTGTVLRTQFLENTAAHGGGLVVGNSSTPVFVNCLIAKNYSAESGGVYIEEGASPSFVRCTFALNVTPYHGCVHIVGATMNMTSSVVALSSGPSITTDAGSALVSYSDIQGSYTGTGNINADPMFVDTANGDFHLQAISPCIDSGDPNSPNDPDSTRTDMGAFPFMHTTLIVNPSALDFGLVDLGTDSVKSVLLFNPTAQAIPIINVSHSLTAFTADTSGLGGQVSPHASFQMAISFNPAIAGMYADTFNMVVHQAGDSLVRIPLDGEAQIILPPVDSLVAQKGPLNGIRLDWAPVTHSITGQPVENVNYIIYGSTSEQGPFVPFGYATTNSYVHPYVLNSQSIYFYRVTADVGTSGVAGSGRNYQIPQQRSNSSK